MADLDSTATLSRVEECTFTGRIMSTPTSYSSGTIQEPTIHQLADGIVEVSVRSNISGVFSSKLAIPGN